MGNRFEYTYNLKNERIRLRLPGGITDTLTYDEDGRLATEKILNGSSAPAQLKHPDAVLRHHVLHYVDAFRVDSAKNLAGWKDTTALLYSGLGHVVRLKYSAPVSNGWLTGAASSIERVLLDAMGNTRKTVDTNNIDAPGVTKESHDSTVHSYQALTGRLRGSLHEAVNPAQDRADSTLYDAAGNVVFSYQPTSGSDATLEDHAYFYGADGKLRVSEYRTSTKVSGDYPYRMVFEEYRYDALGRRVAVIMRRMCNLPQGSRLYACNWESARRTVWQGDAELYEIHAYAKYRSYGESYVPDTARMENDTLPDPAAWLFCIGQSCTGVVLDVSPNFGRVAYTHGPGLDQPLSAIRINFTKMHDMGSTVDTIVFDPITVAPHWNWRGQADFGTLADGAWRTRMVVAPGDTIYVSPPWRIRGFMFTQQMADIAQPQWWGSLMNLKEDMTGTQYRRNRYLDPSTGRFTQEDPIGLAGGLNLYGFAAGDPVNFSDPFGLCHSSEKKEECKLRDADEAENKALDALEAVLAKSENTMCRQAGAVLGELRRQGQVKFYDSAHRGKKGGPLLGDSDGKPSGPVHIYSGRSSQWTSSYQTMAVTSSAVHEVAHTMGMNGDDKEAEKLTEDCTGVREISR